MCIYIYIYLQGGGWGCARDSEATYKVFNQLLDKNATACKGSNQLQGFQPTTKVSANLLDKKPHRIQDINPTYKTNFRPLTRLSL